MAMKQFTYAAMDGQGKEQRGRIDAESEQDAAAKLRQGGLFATSVKEAKSGGGAGPGKTAGGGGARPAKKGGFFAKGGGTIGRKQLTTTTRQLATLLEAGLPLVRALRTLERQGRPGIFLVPEQSTHSAERELLADPALPGLRHVQVLSFTRLAFRLREEAGVPEPPRITAPEPL